MLTIRQSQIQALQRPSQEQFETTTLAHLQHHYPIDHQLLGDTGLLKVVRAGHAEGLRQGLVTQGDIRQFVLLRLVLGSGFLRDPLLPWAVEAAGALGEAGTLARLQAEAAEHLELANGADGRTALRAMLRATALSFEDAMLVEGDDASASTLRLLRRLWPERFRMLPMERRGVFLQAAGQSARWAGMDSPGPAQLHAVLMFLLGAEYTTDPALPWAAEALAASNGAAPLGRARALYDAGVAAVDRLRPLLTAADAG
jgi:hypothetical protein